MYQWFGVVGDFVGEWDVGTHVGLVNTVAYVLP